MTRRVDQRGTLAHYIREKTRDGYDLVDFVLDVLAGKRNGRAHAPTADNTKLRMEAVAWLADRGFGKPVQEIDIEANLRAVVDESREQLREYSVEELEEMKQKMLPQITIPTIWIDPTPPFSGTTTVLGEDVTAIFKHAD